MFLAWRSISASSQPVRFIGLSTFWGTDMRPGVSILFCLSLLSLNHLDLHLDTIYRGLDSEVKRLNALPEFERAADQQLNVDTA